MKPILLSIVICFFILSNCHAKCMDTDTVNLGSLITTQPLDQLDCEGASVKFKVIASGSGLTYTWQYKRPTDVGFIILTGSESNTSYPSSGEIKIDNVGSAQYPDGTQFQVEVSNGSVSEISNSATLSVNEIVSLSGGTNVKQCYGTNYSYTVATSYPANVVSYQWKKSVVSGVWDVISDGGAYSGSTTATLNITAGTPAESAEYRVYITFTSSGTDCNTASYSRTRMLTFLPLLTTPVVDITQPTCLTPTGTISVSIQSVSDTYSFDNGLTYQASNVKSGLAIGSYDVIIKNEKACVSPILTCQIISETSIWDGTTWLNGDPNTDRRIVFNADFSSTSNLEGCSCQVANEAKVVINGDHTLKVTDAVAVSSGSLTFENNASLVQINDAAINTGTINYKRFTSPVRRYDFTFWSSPVIGQTLKDLSPNTLSDKYYGYNPNVGWIIYYNGDETMESGKGYSVRAPQTFSTTDAAMDTNPVFTGVPNNGIINLSLAANMIYLLGNPYPSALDADMFLDANSTVLEGTLYFWTHNTPPSKTIVGDAVYNYTSDDYSTYNRTGGVVTSASAISGGDFLLGKIAAAQGFFAPSSTNGGTLIFNNSMRVEGGVSGVNNSQFFKRETSFKGISLIQPNKNRIWLNLTNKEGVFKQMLIGYIAGATNDYDAGFDGVSYGGNQYVDFYSVNNTVNLAIQGRAFPFVKKDSVVLGYKSIIKGDFEISIAHTDGILDTQQVFIEDTYLNILHDLKKTSYVFNTEKGIFNNRFILRFTDETSIEKAELTAPELDEDLLVSVCDKIIKINSCEELISKISIYNILGQLVYQNNEVKTNEFLIEDLNIGHQVLVVKVALVNEEVHLVKIVY